ncbi:BRCA1-associated protein [Histomonas meleagridis]|uniref:BRCA1-associated protein n=1 Tax=Histomonas meleagridis TaxID=135588 RepID=UPI003559A2D9|nr:BRCA1-associated protein [Histomonas meleagridis]KAH0797929.1 BRCA1-associated protein [Histomonas meleagridis]
MFELEILGEISQVPPENPDIREIAINDMKLWKLMTTLSPHLTWDFPILHPSRSNTIMILAIPNGMKVSDLLKFIQTNSPQYQHITIIHHLLRIVIIQFQTQEGADAFYMNSLGVPFDIKAPTIRCISLFLRTISPELNITPITTFDEEPTREFNLPFCPICFQYFDPLISTYFASSNPEDVNIDSFKLWGAPKCKACNSIFGENTCSSCSETIKLWVCLECGHIGCGRDQNKHAVLHFDSTQHRFSLRYDIHWLWDYIADRSVERAFHDQPHEANDEVVVQYKKMLLDGISSIRKKEEEEIEEMSNEANDEIQNLMKQIEILTSQENQLEADYQLALKIKKDNAEIEKKLSQIKNSPEMTMLENLNQKNTILKKQIKVQNERSAKLFKLLEEREDVSDKVILDLK